MGIESLWRYVMARTLTVSDRKVILARLNWQSGGSRIDSMTDGFGGEDFHWEGRAAGKPLKMTIEMGYDGLCDLYVHHSGRWLKTKKQYRKREVERLAEIVLDALESGQTTNPWFLEYRGQEIFTQVRRASLGLGGRTLTASDRSALIRLASTMAVGSSERKAILARVRTATDPLVSSVKDALKKGQFIGEPRIGSYTVAPEGIVVETTVSVVVPPSKVLVEAPPKETLKMVFDKPELLSDVPESKISDIPFQALNPAQFKTLVKKMGGLGQYSDEVLRALLEGRKAEIYEPQDLYFEADPKDVASYVGGAKGDLNDWGGGEAYEILIKGGVVTGTGSLAYAWENPRGLTIKRDVPDYPYIKLDPAVHGPGDPSDSTHPSLAGAVWDSGEERPRVLPKGTPGVVSVDVLYGFRLKPTPLASLPRSELESLVQDIARWG